MRSQDLLDPKRVIRFAVGALVSVQLLLAPSGIHAARADIIGGVASVAGGIWGIAVDPLKLGKGSENILASVERIQAALDQASKIEATTNADLQARLDQVQDIVNKVQDAVDHDLDHLATIVSEAEKNISDLEQKIYTDVSDLIYKGQCAVQYAATVQFQQAIADAVSNIHDADPGIDILGFRIINFSTKKIEIVDPDKAYIFLRDKRLKELETIKADDKAYEILSTYGNIVRAAYFAVCGYRDPTVVGKLLEQELEFERRAAVWGTISPAMEQ